MADSATNPLLQTTGYPQYDAIRPEHIAPAVEQLLASSRAILKQVEGLQQPNWEELFGPLEKIDRLFEQSWKPIGHLTGVANSPELRDAYQSVLPDVVQFGLEVRQSEAIYREMKSLRESADFDSYSQARKRLLEQRLLGAELSGIALKGEKREQFNAIASELSKLASDFSNHVLDATKEYELIVTDAADAEGWPDSLKNLTSQSYNASKGEDQPESTPAGGPWKITLEVPVVQPFWQHCQNRELREETYRAYISRASSGELDNTPLCERILELRQQQAELLGYENYAAVSLAEKMAENVAAVDEMFETLLKYSRKPAEEDLQELEQLASENDAATPLKHWDIGFWAERLREKRYEVTEETLRQYFQHDRVLNGLFSLIERLFGVTVKPAANMPAVWNKDVQFYEIHDGDKPIAAFFYDPYSRPADKRGGAWMDVCLDRRVADDGVQLPVAHLVCNCTPPVGNKPALMTFREVETLFHEFGHGLQHMLTTVDEPDVAGINGVEWDAVELPSQFMENWCYHKPTLLGMTAHVDTGAPLPDDLFDKLVAARNYRAGSNSLRQLTFGMTDMQLHTDYRPGSGSSVFDVQKSVMDKTAILPMLPEDRFLCSFQHIFAGGYAAGYYSYKWAEVLAADAFSAFEEAGLDNESAIQEVGRRFRETILSQGGSEHPMDLFKEFRGREPDPQALLQQTGLLENDERSSAEPV